MQSMANPRLVTIVKVLCQKEYVRFAKSSCFEISLQNDI